MQASSPFSNRMVLVVHHFDMLNLSAVLYIYLCLFKIFSIPASWKHVFFCVGCSAVSYIYNSFFHTSFTGSVHLKQNVTPNIEGKDKLKTANFICKFAYLSTWRLPNDPAIKTIKYVTYSIKYIVWLAAKGFQYVFLIWVVHLLSLYDFTVVFGTWHSKNSQKGVGNEMYAKKVLHLKRECWYFHTTFGSTICNQM